MKRYLWVTAMIAVAAVFITCAMKGAAKWATVGDNEIVLMVENGYSGTGLLRLSMFKFSPGISEHRLATLYSPVTKVRIPTSTPLDDWYFKLEVSYEETWYSENLFMLRPGDCWVLIVGAKPKYSAVRGRCREGEYNLKMPQGE